MIHLRSLSSSICAALCLLLCGCTVGPAYHRPSVPLPAAYTPSGSPATQPSSSLGDMDWWKLFQDPDLQDLIRQALAHNQDMKIAAARVALVQAEFAGLRASYEPQIGAQVNSTLQRISPIGLPQDRTSGNPAGSATILGVQASWEIDFWGKYRRANEAARASMLSTRAAGNAVRSSLVAAVASAYFNLLQLDDQSAAAQRMLQLRQDSLALLQARLQQGVSSLPDVQLAQIEVQQQRQTLALLRRATQDRISEIHDLLGETTGAVPHRRSIWDEALPTLGPGLPSSLLERRPDIQQAEQDLIAANANIGVVKAAYFPNIGITAGGGLESTAFRNLFSGNAETWMLQPAVNLPLFTGGRIHAQVQQASAQRDIASHQYVATVEAAFRDVAQALAYRAQAEAAVRQQTSIVDAAKASASLASARRSAGVSSSMDVIEFNRALLSAQMDSAQMRYEQLDADVRLYRALGGGWHP